MIRNRAAVYSIFTFSLLLCVLSAFNLHGVLVSGSKPPSAESREPGFVEHMQVIDSALKKSDPTHFFSFSGDFESPFRVQAEVSRRPVHGRRRGSGERARLVFKGILMKESPLAIIEDENGKTFICKRGDLVHGQRVERILSDRITLSNSEGTYTLNVPEE